MSDERFMKRALALARRGAPWASPNPLVGAVIVRDGRVIGEGYHRRYGGRHAEIEAIENASEPVRGATMYVTLEPCVHQGKTPPCADRLIAERPARVVVGTADPNPLVSGRGIRLLKRHGIETAVGVLEGPCRDLNEVFFAYIRTRVPFVTLKLAQSIDGRIATSTGDSRWISSEPSRAFAHRLRSRHDAVLVGIGTVLRDDPELTCRHVRGRDPLRVIVDSSLRVPLEARVLQDQGRVKTVVYAAPGHDREKRAALARRGIEVRVAGRRGRVDLRRALADLGKRQVSSVLVEGGAGVLTSFIRSGMADRLVAVTAPKIIGSGKESVGDLGITRVDRAVPLAVRTVLRMGGDVIVDARFLSRPQGGR